MCVFVHLQSRDNISIRWDWGLNHKRMAYFFFPKDDVDLRLMPGALMIWSRSHTAMVTHGHVRGLIKVTHCYGHTWSRPWSGQDHIAVMIWSRSHTAMVTHGHVRGLIKVTHCCGHTWSRPWSSQDHIAVMIWSRSHTAVVTHGHGRGLVEITYCFGHTWSRPWSDQGHILLRSHMVTAVV